MKECKSVILALILGFGIVSTLMYSDNKIPKTVEVINVGIVKHKKRPGLYTPSYYTTMLYNGIHHTINSKRLYEATINEDQFKGNFRIRDFGDKGITLEYLNK